MMKNLKYFMLLGGLLMIMSSCTDFLDVRPPSKYTEDEIFNSVQKAQYFINSSYRGIEQVPNIELEYYTDNAVKKDEVYAQTSGFTAESCPVSSVWEFSMNRIIDINEFLEKGFDVPYDVIDPAYSIKLQERLKGEAYGLRAWYQWLLLKNFAGPDAAGTMLGFPIIDSVITQDEANQIARGTYLDCFNKINDDIDSAYKYIPYMRYEGSGVLNDQKNVGRISREMLMALRARLALYAASPAYEAITWEEAAEMTWASVDSIENGFIDINKLKPYFNFNNTQNPDDFWRSRFSTSNALETAHFPPSMFGRGECNPTHNLVKAFSNDQGYPIDNLLSFHNPNDPYTGRDTRLERFIFHNGQNDFLDSYVGVFDGGQDASGSLLKLATRTGFYMKKYLSENVDLTPNTVNKTSDTKYYAYLTRQGLYLDFAEAAIMAYGTVAKADHWSSDGIRALQTIQKRGGISENKGYLVDFVIPTNDVDELINIVRNERRIEFAFEGERYYDIRRWKLPVEELNQKLYGVEVTYLTDSTFTYEEKEIGEFFFEEKMYYNPIPRAEVLKSNALVQNAGW